MNGYAISPGWRVLMLDMGLPPERVLRRAGLPLELFERVNQRQSLFPSRDRKNRMRTLAGPSLDQSAPDRAPCADHYVQTVAAHCPVLIRYRSCLG